MDSSYNVLEISDATLFMDRKPVQSNGTLSLYVIDGFYTGTLSHLEEKKQWYSLFQLPESKREEAHDFYHQLNRLLWICINSIKNMNTYYTAMLQTLCDVIRNQTDWSPTHIAVTARLQNVYEKEGTLSQWINSQAGECYYTPLHMACELKESDIVTSLIEGGADLCIRDINGNTPLHLAIDLKSMEIFQILASSATVETLNLENSKGETPLHVACRCNKPKMCKILLKNGADQFRPGSIEFPMHYALKHKSVKVVYFLVKNCPDAVTINDITIKLDSIKDKAKFLFDFPKEVLQGMSSDTSLHVAIVCHHIDEAMTMITDGIPLNAKDWIGNTALHLAVMHDCVMLTKMLLLFGANDSCGNKCGETPKDVAEKISLNNKQVILDILSSNIAFAAQVKEALPPSVCGLGSKVLCLDGGGMRSLILTQILGEIENCCSKGSKDLFDWIAGTSAGCVMAMCLAQGKSASYVQRLFFRLKDEVFAGCRPYDEKSMENFLKKEFGENATLGSLSGSPKVLVSSVKADRKPMQLHFFKNYDATETDGTPFSCISNRLNASDVETLQKKLSNLETPLWKAARCSSAAPTYLRSEDGFLDGGLLANNPTLDALTEIHRYNKTTQKQGSKEKIAVVLSIGTGTTRTTTARSVDIYRPKNPKEVVKEIAATVNFVDMFFDAACASSGHIVDRARAWCEMMGTSYFRLDPMFEEDTGLDEVDTEKLIDLMWNARMYLKENICLLREIVATLL